VKVCEITAAVPPPEDIHGVLTHNCAVSPSAFGRRPSRHHKPPGCRWNVEKEEVVAVATAVPASKDDDGAPFLPQDRAVRVARGRCVAHGFERRPRVVPVHPHVVLARAPRTAAKCVDVPLRVHYCRRVPARRGDRAAACNIERSPPAQVRSRSQRVSRVAPGTKPLRLGRHSRQRPHLVTHHPRLLLLPHAVRGHAPINVFALARSSRHPFYHCVPPVKYAVGSRLIL
jgi:hypothetical protein